MTTFRVSFHGVPVIFTSLLLWNGTYRIIVNKTILFAEGRSHGEAFRRLMALYGDNEIVESQKTKSLLLAGS